MAKNDVRERAKTPVGRWVFEHIVTPRPKKAKDAAGKETTIDQWQLCVVFDAGTDLEPLKQLAREIAEKAFGPHWQAMVQQGSIKWPFRDGGEINPNTGGPRFGDGTVYINVSSNHGVEVVSRYRDPKTGKARMLLDRNGKPLVDNVTDLIYPGVYGRCGITVSSFWNESKGVTMFLNTAQTLEYGERLASGASAEEDFADDLDDLPEADMPDDADEAPAATSSANSLL